ncbi:MAG: hypothetical protein GOVbin52_35 [Prokaryotic dsDNA virus sp.]|nr:MAG: hypothetical protein GOVbin52_35 [Prokaryotic dsDNA virus sp.]HBX91763.1 hypothetical protein [Hyphomonas sp.]|tara:strand:+ start:35714 stop:35914 length:201 start_codon:yes stop_codon:yes gene_type:complete
MSDRMKKYRQETLAGRGAKNVCFVAEKEDQERIARVARYLEVSNSEAIRTALKWAEQDVQELEGIE